MFQTRRRTSARRWTPRGRPRTRGGRPRAPAGRYVTVGVAVACTVLFLLGPASGFTTLYGTGEELRTAQTAAFHRWGVLPAELWGDPAHGWTTLLTALFVHGNWVHLCGNVLFLLVFGRMVEERLGRLHFLVCYLAVGALAMLAYAVAHPDSEEALVGASGAISGVLGAFLFLFPRARVTGVYPFLLFLPLRFPAWLVLVFWITLQWLALRADREGPGIAHLTHVTGFALGFLYAWGRCRGGTRVGANQATEEAPP